MIRLTTFISILPTASGATAQVFGFETTPNAAISTKGGTYSLTLNSGPSFFAGDFSRNDSTDVTAMSLQSLAVPEPTTVIVWGLYLLGLVVGAKHLRKLAV